MSMKSHQEGISDKKNPSIEMIGFIGKKAHGSFLNSIATSSDFDSASIECVVLPSSSPANSRVSVDEKARVWRDSMAQYIPEL